MLIRAMLLIAFVTVLAETAVYGAAALARMTFHARERAALRAAFSDAIRAAQTAAAGGAISAPSATCVFTTDKGCAITVRTTISVPTPVAGATPSSCPNGDCTVYMQNNSHVAESRASYTIAAQVIASNGDVLATRRGVVAFRTFATPPYAALVGSLDDTLDAMANGGISDDAGNESATSSTLIHVDYQQSGNPATQVPADVWRALDEHPATAAPSWDN
jgi:hypothetical protein